MTSDKPVDPALPRDDDNESAGTAEFGRALEEFERDGQSAAQAAASAAADVSVGARVSGTVVSVGEEHVLVDFGGRSEAVAELRHFRGPDGAVTVKPGDRLDLFVVQAGDQLVLGPSVKADAQGALRSLREAHATGMPVSGRVTGVNSGGLEVDLSGLRAFCPMSQVETSFCADASVYVGRTLEFLVTSVGESKGSVVVSRRQLLRRGEEEKAGQLLASLKPGDELEGKVARIEGFGAFIDLGGVDGMVHVSEIRHERVAHPGQVLKVGDAVKVKVLRVEPGKDGKPRIALSMKATAPDPWVGIEARYPVGARVMGVVARLADFGAFVTLEPGVDGLVHVSEVALERIAHARDVLTPGQTVEAVVLGVDAAKKRVSLSVRRASEGWTPEQEAAASAPRGERPPRREGPPRGGERPPRGRDRDRDRDRPSREPRGPIVISTNPGEPELTAMAIALRAAMERAKKKQEDAGQ